MGANEIPQILVHFQNKNPPINDCNKLYTAGQNCASEFFFFLKWDQERNKIFTCSQIIRKSVEECTRQKSIGRAAVEQFLPMLDSCMTE